MTQEFTMTSSTWLAASLLFLAAATAHAHAHLTSSDPGEGSTGKSPGQIVLTFSEPARLTALSLQRKDAETRKLALPTTTAARHTIPLSNLAPGSYTLEWRALGGDGHITSGAVHFTVVESAATAGGAGHRQL
jgi:methionine-rich copper-binding protein CopC